VLGGVTVSLGLARWPAAPLPGREKKYGRIGRLVIAVGGLLVSAETEKPCPDPKDRDPLVSS
jgi:hypothetical protein